MVGCVLFTPFIGYILNHNTDPVKNELVFGVLNLLFFKTESNNYYIKSNNFNIPCFKVGQGFRVSPV